MGYTQQDVARISGVPEETLQFYDAAGLLAPAYWTDERLPCYKEEELLRLQQIMLYREFNASLSVIMDNLERTQDRVETLALHKQKLIETVLRLQKLMDTIDRTADCLRKQEAIVPEQLFSGFDPVRQALYNRNELFPPAQAAAGSASKSPVRAAEQGYPEWSKEDYLDTQREADAIYMKLCEAIEDGCKPGDPKTQEAVRMHYEWVCHFYTPTREIYLGLGQLYVEQEEFKKLYDSYHPKLAEFLRDSIQVYADNNLK